MASARTHHKPRDIVSARSASVCASLKDSICSINHLRESLQTGIMCLNVTDAHEQMFEALNVDSHQLWNKFTHLFILHFC